MAYRCGEDISAGAARLRGGDAARSGDVHPNPEYSLESSWPALKTGRSHQAEELHVLSRVFMELKAVMRAAKQSI